MPFPSSATMAGISWFPTCWLAAKRVRSLMSGTWNAASASCRPGHWRLLVSYAFARDGTRIVFHTAAEKQLVLWDLEKRAEVSRMPLDFLPETAAARWPGPPRVAVNASPGQTAELRILDLENRTVVTSWKDKVGNKAMDWSSDGRLIAVGDQDGQIFVWDVEHRRQASVMRGQLHQRCHSMPVRPAESFAGDLELGFYDPALGRGERRAAPYGATTCVGASFPRTRVDALHSGMAMRCRSDVWSTVKCLVA